jgi:hypothetical protein
MSTTALAPPSYILNQAMMMSKVMMMNLVEMTQWNNGGPFLDSDGLGIAAADSSQAIPTLNR